MNDYVRAIIYAFISGSILVILRLIVTFIETSKPEFYSSNQLNIFVIQAIFVYIVIFVLNCYLLNGLKFEHISGKSIFEQAYYIYTLVYFALTLIVSRFLITFISYLQGNPFNFGYVIAFTGIIDVAYFIVIPLVYANNKEKLKKLKWF